ncbi:MAG: N-acetyltransferase family protein [Oscillospiraceae bacterium]|jgi:phosphinothricin acetyltransferase
MPSLPIRPATPADVPAITAIYQPYVAHTTASFETVVLTEAAMAQRMARYNGQFPWLVYQAGAEVLGYCYASPLSERGGYAWSAAASIYVREGSQRGGMGRALYAGLIALLAAQGYRALYGILASPNMASVRFHEAMGFRREGLLTHAGYKFGRPIGVSYYAKDLLPVAEDPPPPRPFASLSKSEVDALLRQALGQA